MADGDTRALVCLTLNRLGRPQPSYVATLWNDRAKLSPFGIAMLAVAVSEGGGDKALLDPMLAEVRRADQESPAEAWYEGERSHGWSMASPLRAHAAALLAFADSHERNEAAGKLLTGLLHRQDSYGMWGNTQENVYGIMGVAALVGHSDTPGESPRGSLRVGSTDVDLASAEKVSSRVRRYRAPLSQVGIGEGREGTAEVTLDTGAGMPTFVAARLSYEVPLTGKNREAVSKGFRLTRIYEATDGTSLEGRSLALGEVVRVRLRVDSGEARHYVALADLLPAGLEALNTNLATTERVSLGESTPEREAALQWLSFQETRDARVAFYADELPAGTFEYVYLARATTPGHFTRPPASVEAMYEPEVRGSTAIDEVEVGPSVAATVVGSKP
jgi:uncharacterized protein YfaS (alpha-2-macroglobulin family)